jgi:RNA polymerase sigma factor (sigma-70 family)
MALRCGGGLSDHQLLESFLARGDQAAFEELVRRHGPMVLRVCYRALGNHADAEDAFQSTFLVLARKAADLRARELVGGWLHGVAYRTALRAKAMITRRRGHERRAGESARSEQPIDDHWQDLLPYLDQELVRLPERYRVAIVLCDLEGVTRREAARQLGVPTGTLSGRLTRARRLLARRLVRHGWAPSGAVLAALLTEPSASAQVSSTLTTSTAHAAVLVAQRILTAGAVPARVAALTEGVIKTMLLTKLKAFVGVALLVIVGGGVVGLANGTGAGESATAGPAAQYSPTDDLEALRLEVEALRKGLEATRQRVKILEGRVELLKPKEAAAWPPSKAGGLVPAGPQANPYQLQALEAIGLADPKVNLDQHHQPLDAGTVILGGLKPPQTEDPLGQAQAALKALREARDQDKVWQTADLLEKALKQLKERDKPKSDHPPEKK